MVLFGRLTDAAAVAASGYSKVELIDEIARLLELDLGGVDAVSAGSDTIKLVVGGVDIFVPTRTPAEFEAAFRQALQRAIGHTLKQLPGDDWIQLATVLVSLAA